MKKSNFIFPLLFVFSFSLALPAAEIDHSIYDRVTTLYQIKDEILINFEGKVFPRIPFKDTLHEKLADTLKDPDWANAIYSSYEKHIEPTLDPVNLPLFKNALLKVCQLLGTLPSRSEKALIKSLALEGFPIEEWRNHNEHALPLFLKDLHPAHIKTSPHLDEGPARICIITTTTTGGNLSVALAVKAYLDTFPELFETTIVDYEAFAEFDPMKIATGKYSKESIYRLLQQESHVDEQLGMKDILCQEVGKYIPNRMAQKIKTAIQDLRPHLIISTRNYYADDFNLLQLGIPLRMLNCDHDICFFHENLIGKVDPKQVKFWLPSPSPRFFKKLFNHCGQDSLYQAADDWQNLMKKIAQITHSSFPEINEQFEVIGFPVRPEFKKITVESELKQIKQKWDLRAEEKGVLIEMGANGLGILENIFNLLKNETHSSIPIKYYFACGRNDELRSRLQLMAAKNLSQNSVLKRCSILSYLEAAEKNELLNICSLMIAKPGGSTQAEITEIGIPMFLMHIHQFCEEGNREKLLANDLAYEYDAQLPLMTQIEETLHKVQMNPPRFKDPEWKRLILEKLRYIGRTNETDDA